jgi:hypothetical protein
MSKAHHVKGSKMVLQITVPPKWSASMLSSEWEGIKFYQSHVDYMRVCEAACVQSGTTCTAVLLRLCTGTKSLKAAVLIGTVQHTILQQPVTVKNVTEDELKNWLKPERDENREASDAKLEKLIAKAEWLYGVSCVMYSRWTRCFNRLELHLWTTIWDPRRAAPTSRRARAAPRRPRGPDHAPHRALLPKLPAHPCRNTASTPSRSKSTPSAPSSTTTASLVGDALFDTSASPISPFFFASRRAAGRLQARRGTARRGAARARCGAVSTGGTRG